MQEQSERLFLGMMMTLGSLEQVIEVYEDSKGDKLQAVLRAELYQKMIKEMDDRADMPMKNDGDQ